MTGKYFGIENPFRSFGETVQKMEFSKKLGGALKSANRLRQEAVMEFYNRRMPSSAAKELAGEYNRAIRLYNKNRQKLVNATQRGYFDGSEKTFSIEQNLMNAAATFQRVWTLLLRYPRNVDRTNNESQTNRQDVADTPHKKISSLRTLGYSLGAATILLACGTIDNIATATAVPSETANENDNSAQGLVDSTQDGSEIDPNSLATEQPSNVQEIAFQDNGEPVSTYARFAMETGVSPETATDFGSRIGTDGLSLIDEKYNDFYKNDYQIPYAIPKGTADNIQSAWLDIKTTDASGRESYLNVTVEGGNACAKEANPKFDTTGSRLDLTASDGVIARLIDKDGKAVCGVDLSASNPNERQWKVLDENGMLVDQQGQIIPTPTSSNNVSPEESPIVISNPEVISGMVKAYASGEIPFPPDMNKEQYSAFIDGMNDLVGRKAIYVETTNNAGKKIVLYFDIAKSKMVELPGTYSENKAIIDQNVLEVFVKISEEPGTGNIQFINSKGELITSPNSANIDWSLRVDSSNYKDGLIDLPTVDGETSPGSWFDRAIGGIADQEMIKKMKKTLVPGILMDGTVSRIVRNQNGWTEYPTLNVMFLNVNKETGKKNYGISAMAGGTPNIYLGKEGGTMNGLPSKALKLLDSDDINQFEAGAVYYIGMAENQQLIWDESLKADIDALEGAGNESSSFENATNNSIPREGNIIVTAPIFIKKK